MNGLPFYDVQEDEWNWTVVSRNEQSYNYWMKQAKKNWNSRASAVIRQEKQKRPRTKRFTNLSCLFLQPREILIEVLTQLHPLDLVQLSHTTKTFRALVMSLRSEWLWAESFNRQLNLPPCPPDMPYPKWANLLFGAYSCQDCEASYAEPDFYWRRRLCWDCMFNRVEQISRNESDTTTVTKQIEDASTKQPEWKTRHDAVQFIADRMAARHSYVDNEMHNSFPWPGVLLEDNSSATIKQLTENAVASTVWANEIDGQIEVEYSKMKTFFFKRFKSLGHEGDIVALLESYDALLILPSTGLRSRKRLRMIRRSKPFVYPTRSRRLTSHLDWVDFQPQLSSILNDIVKNRTECEQKILLDSRMLAIREAFDSHCDSLPTQVRSALPTTLNIVLYEPFAGMVVAPADFPLDDGQVSESIASFVERWPPTTLDEFCSLFPTPVKNARAFNKKHGPQNIATVSFVFRCAFCEKFGRVPTSGCIVGWQAAVKHLRCGGAQEIGPPELSERGYVGAMSLLELLGLDPHTTLPSELGERNLLFTCVQCSNKAEERPPLLTWRECIFHFIKGQQHGTPGWKVLLEEDIEKIKGWKAQEDDLEGDIWESAADLFL